MSKPRTITLRSSFPALDTGKPLEYTYNLDDPEAMAEYSAIKKAWDAEGARYRASQRNVFRTKPGSPEDMQLGLLQERNLRDMRKGAPQLGAAIGEGIGGAAGIPVAALTKMPAAVPAMQTGGAWLGGAAGGALIGENPVSAGNEMAAWSLAGHGVGAGLRGLGSGLMRSAMDPPAWISESFPGTWRTALRERIGLSNPRTLTEGLAETGIPGAERAGIGEVLLGNRTGLTGSAASAKKIQAAEANVQAMLQKAQAVQSNVRLANGTIGRKGAKISLEKDIIPEVRRRLAGRGPLSRKPAGRIDALVEADQILRQIVDENPGAIDLVRAHQIKRGAQTEAADLLESLNSARASGSILDQTHTSAQIRERVMKTLNDVMLERLRAAVPGYRAAEARVTDLMGLERALKFREAQQVGGLDVRAGNSGALRFDPFGFLPPHLRSTVARNLAGPAPIAAQVGKFPVATALSNLGRTDEETQR